MVYQQLRHVLVYIMYLRVNNISMSIIVNHPGCESIDRNMSACLISKRTVETHCNADVGHQGCNPRYKQNSHVQKWAKKIKKTSLIVRLLSTLKSIEYTCYKQMSLITRDVMTSCQSICIYFSKKKSLIHTAVMSASFQWPLHGCNVIIILLALLSSFVLLYSRATVIVWAIRHLSGKQVYWETKQINTKFYGKVLIHHMIFRSFISIFFFFLFWLGGGGGF